MNMTGDPNQLNRPTVFGLDYNYPADWAEYPPRNDFLQGPHHNNFIPPADMCPVGNYSFYSNFGTVPSPISFPLEQMHGYSHEFSNRAGHVPLRCKRKTDSPPPVHTKQHITEERMAEHLSKLHISSENPAPTTEPESTDTREKRLYMCKEMRKLQTDSILPASLLERMNRPCKALVLWTPPRRPVCLQEESQNNNNNNEDEVPDNNLMDLDR